MLKIEKNSDGKLPPYVLQMHPNHCQSTHKLGLQITHTSIVSTLTEGGTREKGTTQEGFSIESYSIERGGSF